MASRLSPLIIMFDGLITVITAACNYVETFLYSGQRRLLSTIELTENTVASDNRVVGVNAAGYFSLAYKHYVNRRWMNVKFMEIMSTFL